VLAAVGQRAVAVQPEDAEGRGQSRAGDAFDEALGLPAVGDQRGDGDHAQTVTTGVGDEIADPGHRPVLVEDLADDARRRQACQAREIDGRLGVPGALEHPAAAGAQREDVAGVHEVLGGAGGVDGGLDGARAVVGGDAGGDALTRLDRDCERGFVQRLVAPGHGAEAELLAALGAERQADQAACLLGHEVDRLGRGELRGHHEVALVLAVFAVAHDHGAPGADVGDRVIDGVEWTSHAMGPLGMAFTKTRMVAARGAVK
jgi:hypothetical protein